MELPVFLFAHVGKKLKNKVPNLEVILFGQFDPNSHTGKQCHNPQNLIRLLALGDSLTKGPK